MRAVWYDRTGPAEEVLQYGELPDPQPGLGEVRVRVHASGINPADLKRRSGSPYPMEYPRVVPHSDGAGVVDALGDGADPGLLGQRVWLFNGQRLGRWMGTAAEWIALDAKLVAPLPEVVGFAEGATLGIPCMTAHRCLFADGPVRGLVVLVTGGAGAVGHHAIQWARWGGAAQVIATASTPAKAAHARAAGADVVLDYRREDVAARVRKIAGGVDRVVEVDLGANWAAVAPCLNPHAVVAAYASTGPAPEVFRPLMQRNAVLRAVLLNGAPWPALEQARADIAARFAGDGISCTVAATLPLAETVAAHRLAESGNRLGTVVVDPGA